MNYEKSTVVVEIAGRDSYAALIKYALTNKGSYLLPTITKIPTEEPRYYEFIDTFKMLSEYIKELGSHLYEPIWVDTKSWRRRFTMTAVHQFDYGFSSPCLACHSIVHGIRVDLALSLSGKIITGEKQWHGEFIKLNQNDKVFKMFDEFFGSLGVELIRPVVEESDLELVDQFFKKYNFTGPKYITCTETNKIKVSSMEELDKYKLKEYFENEVSPNLSKLIDKQKEEWHELRL